MARTWVTGYECERCFAPYVHVEHSTADDEPDGLSLLARWCDCGGFLRVARETRQTKGPSGSAA
jgi:hypothetical protein